MGVVNGDHGQLEGLCPVLRGQSHSTPDDCCHVSPAWYSKKSWKPDLGYTVSTFWILAVNDRIVKHGVDHRRLQVRSGPQPQVTYYCPQDFCSLWVGYPCPLQAMFVCVDFQDSLPDGQPLSMPLNIAKLPLSPRLSLLPGALLPILWD